MNKFEKVMILTGFLLCGALASYTVVRLASSSVVLIYAYIGAFACYVGTVYILTSFLQGFFTGFERYVLKKHGVIQPESDSQPSWTSTDMETGQGRELLEIEVPPEVRRWAKESNRFLKELFNTQGAMCVVIGAVPNNLPPEERNEFTELPFHMTYTMSGNMNPLLFADMVNSFNCQLPALLASQGIDAEIKEDDHE